jgi:hypothetical protein
MALPPHHPLWVGLLVILPVAFLSAVLVYARADRLAARILVDVKGIRWVRRRGFVGCLWSTFAVGIASAVLYGWLLERDAARAPAVFHLLSIGLAVVLSGAAVWLRRREHFVGVPELIVLNILWGAGFGWALPALSAVS